MNRIAFSLLIHEQTPVVINQIENILRYNPDCVVVIHVSRNFEGCHDLKQQASIFGKQVWFNPKRLYTSISDGGQMKAHLANMHFLFNASIEFNYLALLASNQMFIRSGLAEYMSRFAIGLYGQKIYRNADGSAKGANYVTAKSLADPFLLRLKKQGKIGSYYYAASEGAFFSYDISRKIYNDLYPKALHDLLCFNVHGSSLVSNFYINKLLRWLFKRIFYAKEEIYFATLAHHWVSDDSMISCGFCYMNSNQGYNIYREDIEDIRQSDYSKLKSDYRNYQVHDFLFSVKRINRILNDPLRKYIDALPTSAKNTTIHYPFSQDQQ